MKKIISALALSAVAISLGAQDLSDALRLSENNYYGTARSIAMGNAFTALGGDLGSVGINPAGAAVNSWSQFTLTPGLTISSSNASYDGGYGLSEKRNASKTNVSLPNIGVNLNYKTGRKRGVKSYSFGFIVNSTAYYHDNTDAAGTNCYNSFVGDIAAMTEELGISSSEFASNPFNNPSLPWASVIGWESGMISNYAGYDNTYIGATESIYKNEQGEDVIGMSRPLDQRYTRRSSGSRQDYLINFAMNVNDNFYIGANVGLVTSSYTFKSVMKESVNPGIDPDDPDTNGLKYDNGDIIYFRNARYRQNVKTSGTGIYAKLGFIWRPVRFIRLGAAVQTPTAFELTDKWQYAGDIQFSDSKYNGESTSNEGYYKYSLKAPFRSNFGAAFILGTKGAFSLDYELATYSQMKYRDSDGYEEGFEVTNEDMRTALTSAHQFRAGLEYMICAGTKLRAGYNFTTCPYLDNNNEAIKAPTHAVSAGIGYSTPGSFFFDLACRGTFKPYENIYPYGVDAYPVASVKKQVWDVAATIGWRF